MKKLWVNVIPYKKDLAIAALESGAEAVVSPYGKSETVLGSTMGSNEDFRQMLKAVTAEKLKPVIDSVYPIEDVREARAKMERAEQFGKIVLRICQ